MSKVQNNVAVENKNARLEFSGQVVMGEYTNRDGYSVPVVQINVESPFDDEVGVLSLSPQWQSDKGIFDYKAKIALKSAPSIPITGYFCVKTFTSKRTRTSVDCVGVFLNNPFFKGDIELRNRNKEQHAVISYLLSERWGIKLSRYADEKDEVVSD